MSYSVSFTSIGSRLHIDMSDIMTYNRCLLYVHENEIDLLTFLKRT